MKIFIYHDYVHNNAPLHTALVRRYGHAAVQYVNADDIIGGALNDNPNAFVMPGGASRYKANKLNGAGNAAIKRYVQNGGTYMGICAGAYYACANTVWAAGTANEIITPNELAFFNGDAVGPIKQFSAAHSRDGSDARIVTLNTNGATTPALYWGGAQFVPHADAAYTVHATFTDITENNAAIISGTTAEGKWLLVSPHIEIDHAALQLMTFNVPDNRYADIAALGNTRGVTLDMFYALLDEFVGK